MLIGSENAEYQIIEALKNSRAKRHKLNEIFVEGIECVKQAAEAGINMTRIIYAEGTVLSDWAVHLISEQHGCKIIGMDRALYHKLCDKENPAELLITAEPKKHALDEIQAANPFVIVFDRPSDRGNLGSLIRSANAFGADAVFVMGHGVDAYDPKVIRASLGSVFHTNVINVDSMGALENFIERQKQKNGLKVIGTDSAGEECLNDMNIDGPVMVIIGNEAKGMSVKLKELCDTIIRIPMAGNVNSLNVSCAASILMWEIFKGRTGKNVAD